MKKVLIIAYQFPPSQAIGAQRPFGLAKHLPKYGWDPIVLTVRMTGRVLDGIRIIETNYKDITNQLKVKIGLSSERSIHDQLGITVTKNYNHSAWKSKVIKLIKDIYLFPDVNRGWFKYAYNAASRILDSESVDAIISTSPPVTSHLIARKLKQKYNPKWIADFRDPWTKKYIYNKNSLIKFLDRQLEIKTISYADALVSVTRPYVDKIKPLHKDKKIFCISNGYNEEEIQKPPPPLMDKFVITYAGSLYSGRRDPSILFLAVDQLIKEKKINSDVVKIRFYGHKEDWLSNEITQYNLNGIVELKGFLSKEEILERERESQLLLLIRWDSKIEIGDCPAKIYEYFNARRPIIAIGGYGGIIKDLLDETNAGKFADNVDILKNIILEYYQEFDHFGRVECRSNDKIHNYHYDLIAKQYSEVLDSIVIR